MFCGGYLQDKLIVRFYFCEVGNFEFVNVVLLKSKCTVTSR